jgi:energy-coupling factor transporter ATP-binding protein EcfA2
VSALHADARVRLPREPYPGLRPFLDFEAALLFGRERQVREVIAHLGQSQFVAVLGGSGSGKSSLIHAGVVPELRSYGIPGAGDLWLPMTCTPGTNVSTADIQARRHSPVTRLARRFAGLLRTRGTPEADARRVTEIADVFRQEAGFARLLDTFGGELNVPPGPDPSEARVLFVLDQFEEIFHPTNKVVEDAGLLVERVLDHFFNPHPRCHVVLTMRSEHLNDCATYLELPDAINKSSYLVRRLDTDELRDAITGPAQRFLRLASRSNTQQLPLPAQVVFDEPVLQRLLRDVQAITHDPDHLPLLQHLLARLWAAALEREEMDVPVPSRISELDLARAVQGGARVDEQPLDERVNTLRACVENWPETLYQWHDAARRTQLDNLFRHLAFKDPNTGLYSQQRIDVDVGAQLMGPGLGRSDLRALLAEGFLGSVDYLFWDDEDPSRVTLKVSHESFIRGWARFRNLIDIESARFDEFLGVLRKCVDWSAGRRGEDYLLEAGELRRLGESGFATRLRLADQRSLWRRALALDRDGARLLRHEGELDGFFAASQSRLADRQRREAALSISRRLLVASTVLFALLPTALFSVAVQGPTMRRAEQLFDAGNRANRATLSISQARVGEAGGTLDSLLRAAELVESARRGESSVRMALSRRLLQTFGGLPAFNDQRDFLAAVFTQAEPPVNGTLRQLLTHSVWRGAPGGSQSGEHPLAAPERVEDAQCSGFDAQGEPALLDGRLWIAGRRSGAGPRPARALFVSHRAAAQRGLEVFSASVDSDAGICTLGAVVLSSPATLESRLVFDASLRYFYYTVEGPSSPLPTVIVQDVDWERSSDGRLRALQRQTLAAITDPQAVAAVRAAAGESGIAAVPTWRVLGGSRVDVSGRHWQIVSSQAQRVEPAAGSLQPLQPAAAGSPCLDLAKSFATMSGFQMTHFETADHCFMVAHGWPAFGSPLDPSRPARDEIRVAVHERPLHAVAQRAAENPPAPVAGLVPFARIPAADAERQESGRWFVGSGGELEGWLMLQLPDNGRGSRFIGLPWSTCALWRQGQPLQALNPPPGQPQADSSSACRARP